MKQQFIFIRTKPEVLYTGYMNLRFNRLFRNLFLLLLIWCLLYFSTGCANNAHPDSVQSAIDSNKAAVKDSASEFNVEDGKFAAKVANAGMTEIQQSKIALEKSDNSHIKSLAEQMIKDHSNMADSLKAIATSLQIKLPDSLSNDSKQTVEKLQNAPAGKFDAAFLDIMQKEHEDDVALFNSEQKEKINDALQTFITTYLPVIQSHLDMIKTMNHSK